MPGIGRSIRIVAHPIPFLFHIIHHPVRSNTEAKQNDHNAYK